MMLSLYVDGVENCAHLLDADITAQAASLVPPPGSYTIRIDSGDITRPGGPADPGLVVHLWIHGGRHLDRATNVATHSRFRSLCGFPASMGKSEAGLRLGRERQAEPEGRAFAGDALDANLAAVPLDEGSADVEP